MTKLKFRIFQVDPESSGYISESTLIEGDNALEACRIWVHNQQESLPMEETEEKEAYTKLWNAIKTSWERRDLHQMDDEGRVHSIQPLRDESIFNLIYIVEL